MLFARSYQQILGDALLELTQNTKVTRISPGSKARSILEAASRNLNQAYNTFDLNFARAFLSGADGKFLDLLGEILGVSRLGIETASVNASTEVVKFFVETGTFGDINSGSAITIPAGTVLSTEVDNSGVSYKLTTGVVLAASGKSQFVSVTALLPGESSNIGSGALTFHNFTNYTDSANNTLKVTNISGIFTGANVETDINYRFRIAKSALASESANETAVLLAALSVPGVANVVLQNRAKGIGTYKVLIKSITPTVSTALIDSVGAVLSRVTAQGTLGIADKPLETGMAFEISLRYQNGVSVEEKDAIEAQIRSAIEEYVNNLDIGEEFILNELVERVLSVSTNIKDIGQPNRPIDNMFIYRESKLRDSKVREQLISNYIPAADERVILEPSLSQPVTITRDTTKSKPVGG